MAPNVVATRLVESLQGPKTYRLPNDGRSVGRIASFIRLNILLPGLSEG
jgi:hypothetical protein